MKKIRTKVLFFLLAFSVTVLSTPENGLWRVTE